MVSSFCGGGCLDWFLVLGFDCRCVLVVCFCFVIIVVCLFGFGFRRFAASFVLIGLLDVGLGWLLLVCLLRDLLVLVC